MNITLKPTPFPKDIPLINSTSHNILNNCVAYLVDICDIIVSNLSS